MDKKSIKRRAIVESAIDVFSKNGFQNSSISEIAQKANVAEGTIYQYFKNKEDLFFSIPIQKTEEFCVDLDLHLQGISGAVNKLRKFIWFYLYFFQTNPEYCRALMLEMRVSKRFVQTENYNAFRRFTDKALEIIKEGQEEGVLRRDVNVYLLRQLTLGVLEHIVTRWLLKDQKYDVMEHYGEVGELILNGISGPKGLE